MNEGINDVGLSHKHISRQIATSLKHLKTQWIDLYQTHLFDEQTSIKVTLTALSDLLHTGKVYAIGCSNYPVWRIIEALWIAEKNFLEPFSVVQTRYSLLARFEFESTGINDISKKYNLGIITYSPLAYGFLTDKYHPYEPFPESTHTSDILEKYYSQENWRIVTSLQEIAQNKGCLASQLALSWVLHQENITAPIIGVRTINQLNELLEALTITINAEEYKILDRVSKKHISLED